MPASRGSGPVAVLVLVAGVLAVLTIAGLGAYFLSEWVGDQQLGAGSGVVNPGGGDASGNGGNDQPEYAGPLTSGPGFASLRQALDKQTGSTKVIDLTVYPGYAVAEVLEGSAPGRTRSLYYDGKFSESGLGTTTDRPLDLARLDPEIPATLIRKVRKVIEDEDSWYLILRAPDAQGAAVWAYASNQYGEGAYVSGRLDGKVVDTVTW